MFRAENLKPLPAFSWTKTDLRPLDLEYLDYYGINFAEKFARGFKHHFGEKELAGYTIAIHYLELPNPKGTIVLLHGYMDHVGLYNHLIKALLTAGYNVLSYDLPGHGLSSGEQAGIPDFDDYQKVLAELLFHARRHLPKPWYLAGQSTGGSIAMDYLMNNPDHGFSKAILLAPLVIPKRWRLIKLQLLLLGFFLQGVPRQFVINSSDMEFLYFLKHQDTMQTRWIKTSWVRALVRWQKHFAESPPSDTPVLVIQGEKDVTVEWIYNLPRILKKFVNYREVLLRDANHHLVQESEELRQAVFAEMLAFLDE